MSRRAQVCAVGLVGVLAWQIARLPNRSGLARMPVFTPASMGIAATVGHRCSESPPGDATTQALAAVPVEHLADALASDGGVSSVESRAALEQLANHHRALLDLRNQRHAWNVEAMELVAELAGSLEPEQLDWVLPTRDLVARQSMDQDTWRRLGLEP